MPMTKDQLSEAITTLGSSPESRKAIREHFAEPTPATQPAKATTPKPGNLSPGEAAFADSIVMPGENRTLVAPGQFGNLSKGEAAFAASIVMP